VKTDILAKVLTVGGGKIVLQFTGGTLIVGATKEEERAFGAVLYQEVRVMISVEPKAVST
jgi:hypothetical protein